MGKTFNNILFEVSRHLKKADEAWFEKSLKEGRKLIVTLDQHGFVSFSWDPPHHGDAQPKWTPFKKD